MKISANIIALCALSATAGAFTTPAPKAFNTALNVSYFSGSSPTTSVGVNGANEKTSISSSPAGGMVSQSRIGGRNPKSTREMFNDVTPITVQGGSLKTCSFSESVDRVSVILKTDGRPLNANVELWQGPDNTPQKMSVYLEDGSLRLFRAIVESPGSSNAIAIRNTGQIEFPLTAAIDCDMSGPVQKIVSTADPRTVQGGAVYTTPFPPSVSSVQVSLKSDGRPLNARVELLQGPNNNKQVMEVYTEDGRERPFNAIIDTPGSGNVIRIVNTATVEFPLSASISAYSIEDVSSRAGGPAGMVWS
jgi:hypothetical protein